MSCSKYEELNKPVPKLTNISLVDITLQYKALLYCSVTFSKALCSARLNVLLSPTSP